MGFTTTNPPSAEADDTSVGTFSWTNKTNGYAEDGSLVTMGSNGTTYYVKLTGFGFAIGNGVGEIPTGSTIDGIHFRIKANRSGAAAGNLTSVKAVKGGSIVGSEKGTITLTTTLTFYDAGGASDLHGVGWTASDIISSSFGIAISGSGTAMGRAQFDCVTCIVYFTAPAGGRSFVTSSILCNSILANGLA